MGLNEQIVQIGAACSDALRYALGMRCSYAIPKLSLLGVLHVILPLLREQGSCGQTIVRGKLSATSSSRKNSPVSMIRSFL